MSCEAAAIPGGTADHFAKAWATGGERVYAFRQPVAVLANGAIVGAIANQEGVRKVGDPEMRVLEVRDGKVVRSVPDPWEIVKRVAAVASRAEQKACTSCNEQPPKASDIVKQLARAIPADAEALARTAVRGPDGKSYALGSEGFYRYVEGRFEAVIPKAEVPRAAGGALLGRVWRQQMVSRGLSPLDGINGGVRAGIGGVTNGLALQVPTEGGPPPPKWTKSWGELFKYFLGE